MASALLMEISKNDHERALFLSRRKAETDLASNLLTAEARGRAEGEALGRVEALIGVAKNLRIGGMGVSDIAKATGLTVDDIRRL